MIAWKPRLPKLIAPLTKEPTYEALRDINAGLDAIVSHVNSLSSNASILPTTIRAGGVVTQSSSNGVVSFSTTYFNVTYWNNNQLLVFNGASPSTLGLTDASQLGNKFVCSIINMGTAVLQIVPLTIPNQQLVNLCAFFNVNPGEGGTLFCDGSNFYLI